MLSLPESSELSPVDEPSEPFPFELPEEDELLPSDEAFVAAASESTEALLLADDSEVELFFVEKRTTAL